MNVWELDKLYLFIAFVIPGFIGLKTYELLVPGDPKDSSKQVIDAIALSCLNYALLLWPILLIEGSGLKQGFPNLYAAFYLFVLFIAPIVWVCVWKKMRTTKMFQSQLPHPTLKPWDYVFSKRKPYWVKVTLKDGTKIAGKYGEKSFTSNAPSKEQIYLEETWALNEKGGFDRVKKRSEGVIILSNDISYVELLKYKKEKEGE